MGDDLGPVPAAPDPGRHDAGLTEPEVLASIAAQAGLRRIHFVAWRDLDDPEAGGSELHAHEIASRWAAAGLDVTFRTSAVPNAPAALTRDGYRVQRQAGRYAVFPGAAWEGIRMGHRSGDALVEIWNGMPFLSPLWYRGPRIVFLHHVHAEMWGMVLPPMLARLGNAAEQRIAPRFYRQSRIVTLSDSSRREIVDLLGLRGDRVTVAPPGVDERYSPGGQRLATPLVVAVGRLVPVKRFDLLIDSLAIVHDAFPDMRAVIVGEGYERARLEARRLALGAQGWLELPGHMADDALVDLYRRAWVLASTSQREGWGMTVTEAAACATPAVVSRIAGHVDAVEDGVSGLTVDLSGAGGAEQAASFARALRAVLGDPTLAARLGQGARRRARALTWEATAAGTLDVLVDDAVARQRRGR
jgi:glycosyltransferase involved in cell wall biosynthesis